MTSCSIRSQNDDASAAPTSAIYEDPGPGHQPLRVRLIGPPELPAWIDAFARLAHDDPWIDLEIETRAEVRIGNPPRAPLDARAWVALEKLLRRRFGDKNPLEPGSPLQSSCQPSRSSGDGRGVSGPDLLLLLGDETAQCQPDDGSPRHGAWRIDTSLLDPSMGGVDLLGTMSAPCDATEVVLELAFPGQDAAPLARSSTATSRDAFALQRLRVLRKLPSLLLRGLRKLAHGELQLPKGHGVATIRLATPKVTFGVGTRAMVQVITRYLSRRIGGKHPPQQWSLVVRKSPDLLDPRKPMASAGAFVTSELGLSWADPCVVEDANRRYVFFEEFNGGLDRGRIAYLELDPDGVPIASATTVLSEAWHLSYPQPFRWRGRWYMTVESRQAKRISVYRADAFPEGWQHEADLLVGRACVDPTLFEHEGLWYLFTGISEEGSGTCDELFLFVGETPLGPFRPHPGNPIVVDVRNARPAGRIVTRSGALYRPAQNCAPSYGAALAFQQITVLTPRTYTELNAGVLAPWSRAIDGCHTYSEAAGIEVLDARSVAK